MTAQFSGHATLLKNILILMRAIAHNMEDKKVLTNTTKEDILIEALPYIQRYEGKTFVIKYGGAAMTDKSLQESFAKDVTLLRKIGINIIIVHGGGKAITGLSEKLGFETRFHNGHRYTDSD